MPHSWKHPEDWCAQCGITHFEAVRDRIASCDDMPKELTSMTLAAAFRVKGPMFYRPTHVVLEI